MLSDVASGDAGPAAAAEHAEAAARLRGEIARLDEPYRSLVILREVQGLAYQEISEALDLSLAKVRVYLHRGRRMLADRLAETGSQVSTAAERTSAEPQ